MKRILTRQHTVDHGTPERRNIRRYYAFVFCLPGFLKLLPRAGLQRSRLIDCLNLRRRHSRRGLSILQERRSLL